MPAVCRSCKAPIRWAKTESGKSMPLDIEPVADGNVVVDDIGVAHVLKDRAAINESLLLGPDTLSFKSHFVTCAFADTHRRKP